MKCIWQDHNENTILLFKSIQSESWATVGGWNCLTNSTLKTPSLQSVSSTLPWKLISSINSISHRAGHLSDFQRENHPSRLHDRRCVRWRQSPWWLSLVHSPFCRLKVQVQGPSALSWLHQPSYPRQISANIITLCRDLQHFIQVMFQVMSQAMFQGVFHSTSKSRRFTTFLKQPEWPHALINDLPIYR